MVKENVGEVSDRIVKSFSPNSNATFGSGEARQDDGNSQGQISKL